MKKRRCILTKRLFSVALALACMATLILPAMAASSSTSVFTDVSSDAWYAEAVAFCWDRGLMEGVSDTLFDPGSRMTRAMLATVLYRLDGEPMVSGTSPFPDVSEDSWYGPAIIWAAENGIIEGYENGCCGPDDWVTREQMVTILWRYAGEQEPEGNADDFTDESSIASWASSAVDWARENGIVTGADGGRFLPKNSAQRCEVAMVLMNYVQYLESSGDEAEPEVDPWEEFYSLFGYLPEKASVPANSYIPEAFVAEEQDDGSYYMTYSLGNYSVGIDVSHYQGTIDWQEVADSGIDFAIIQLGYRGYSEGSLNTDACFEENIEGALDAGLDVGVYFFSQAVSVQEAVEEAEYVLEEIRGYDVTYPVIFDWELLSYSSSRTKDVGAETVTACIAAFCETVEAAGYVPMFYANTTTAYELDMGYLTQYQFWLASYTDTAPADFKYHFDMWQYTSSGTVPGISGRVDMNICLYEPVLG